MSEGEQMREILAEFTAESREQVDEFEAAMLSLERGEAVDAATAAAFRAMHSIKGNASFLALGPFETLTHAGETVLARIRERDLDVDQPGVVDALLGLVDRLRQLLDLLERGEALESVELSPALRQLAPFVTRVGEAPASLAPPEAASASLGEVSREEGPSSTGKIRVDVGLLDRLMNLVGELVLARNQVLQHAADQQGTLGSTAQRLDLVTTQLQEAVMKTRMQPVGSSWTRFPRVVRDLCQELGKRARVTLEGRETELDKRIIEGLHDPLTHLLRNAVDHGVEAPEARVAAGKPAQATIRVRGFHEGGLVNIEIHDDGAGIDVAAIRERARVLGLAPRGALSLDELGERELIELLFTPGFSTREAITKLSGRGVGLDVVRTNIERLGGSIELHSRAGEGTTARIKIPLTLAIIPALIVTTAGERFALPQANLVEIVRVAEDGRAAGSGPRLDWVSGAPILRLRGRLLPLAELGAQLELRERSTLDADRGAASVVVLQAEDRNFGLLVDEVHDTEEIVVKPLWSALEGIACYAGATILGDGRVALILDAHGLAERAGLLGEHELREAAEGRAGRARARESDEASRLELVLLCRGGDGGQLAIPVAEVARLEEISGDRIERTGALEVMQHNREIVPLVRLARVLDPEGLVVDELVDEAAPTLQVVLHRLDGRLAGLVVDELVDVVEAAVELQPATRAGVRGSMVLQGRVTEFVDVEAALRAGIPGFTAFVPTPDAPTPTPSSEVRP